LLCIKCVSYGLIFLPVWIFKSDKTARFNGSSVQKKFKTGRVFGRFWLIAEGLFALKRMIGPDPNLEPRDPGLDFESRGQPQPWKQRVREHAQHAKKISFRSLFKYLFSLRGLLRLAQCVFTALAFATAAGAYKREIASRADFVMGTNVIGFLYALGTILSMLFRDQGGSLHIFKQQRRALDSILSFLTLLSGILLLTRCSERTYPANDRLCSDSRAAWASGVFSLIAAPLFALSACFPEKDKFANPYASPLRHSEGLYAGAKAPNALPSAAPASAFVSQPKSDIGFASDRGRGGADIERDRTYPYSDQQGRDVLRGGRGTSDLPVRDYDQGIRVEVADVIRR